MPLHPSGPASSRRTTQGQQVNGQSNISNSGTNASAHGHTHNNTPHQHHRHLYPSGQPSHYTPTLGSFLSTTQDPDSHDTFSNFSEAYDAGISIPTAAFNTARFGELDLDTNSSGGLTGTSSRRRASADAAATGSGLGGSGGFTHIGGTGASERIAGGRAGDLTRTRRVDELGFDNDDDGFNMDLDSDDFLLCDDDDFDLPPNLEDLPDVQPTPLPPSSMAVSTQGAPLMIKSESGGYVKGRGGEIEAAGKTSSTAVGGGRGKQPNQVMTQPNIALRSGSGVRGGGGSSSSGMSGSSSSSGGYAVVSREEQGLKEQLFRLQQKYSEMEMQIKEKDDIIMIKSGENSVLRQSRDKFKEESDKLHELNKNAEIRHQSDVEELKRSHQRELETIKMDHQFEIQSAIDRRSSAARLATPAPHVPAQTPAGLSSPSQFQLSQLPRQPTQQQIVGFPASQQQQQPSPSQFGRSFSGSMLSQKARAKSAVRDSIPLESFGLGPHPPPSQPRPPMSAPLRPKLDPGKSQMPANLGGAVPVFIRRPILRPRPKVSKETLIQKALLTATRDSTGLRKLGAIGIGALNLHYRHVPGSATWTKFAKLERLNLLCVDALLQLTVNVTKDTMEEAFETTFTTLREAILLCQPWMIAQLVSVLVALTAQLDSSLEDWICGDERTKVPFFARVIHHRFLHKPKSDDALSTVREALQLSPTSATTDTADPGGSTTASTTTTTATATATATAAATVAASAIQVNGDEIPAPARESIPTPLSCIFYLLALLALTPPRIETRDATLVLSSLPQVPASSKNLGYNGASTSSVAVPFAAQPLSSAQQRPLLSTATAAAAAASSPSCLPSSKHSAVSLSAVRTTIDMSYNVMAYESELLQLVEHVVAALLRHGKRSHVYPLLHLRILEAVLMSRRNTLQVGGGAVATGHVYEQTMAIFWQLAQDPECSRIMCGGGNSGIGHHGTSSGDATMASTGAVFEGSTHLVDVFSRYLLLFPPDPRHPSFSSVSSSSSSSRAQQPVQPVWFKTGGVAGAVSYRERDQHCHWNGACPRAKVLVVKILRELTRVNRGQTQLLVVRTDMIPYCVDALREQVEVCLAHATHARQVANKAIEATMTQKHWAAGAGAAGTGQGDSSLPNGGVHGGVHHSLHRHPLQLLEQQKRRLRYQRHGGAAAGAGIAAGCDAHVVLLHLLTFLNSLEGAMMSNAWLERTNPERLDQLASCASIVVANGHERGGGGDTDELQLQALPKAVQDQAHHMLFWAISDEQKEDERIALAR